MPRPREESSVSAAHGCWGEDVAAEFLRRGGFVIVDRNSRPSARDRRLEIDIVAQEPGANILHVVEVKTRTTDLHFDPMQAITKTKIRNLVNAANGYITYYNLPMYVQYDVMILIGTPPNLHIHFIPNAFQPPLRTLH